MSPTPEIDLSSPGLAFSALLRLVKPSKIRSLLADEMIEVLDGLEPGFSASSKLTDLAINMLDPADVLLDAPSRSKVISLMPLKKAHELCRKLGGGSSRDPFEEASKLAAKKESFPTLLSFFGVVDDPTAPAAQLPGNDIASVGYGLFEHQRMAAKKTELVLSKPTYRSVLTGLATKRPSTRLLGLTATPGRTWADLESDEELSSFFHGQKVMLEVEGHPDPVTYLMDEGYLARPEFHNLNINAGLDLTEEDFADLSVAIDVPGKMLERLGESTQRNLKIIATCEELVTRHSRVIVFAPSVANARMLAAIMLARGTEALVVTGESAPSHREQAIRRFKSQSPHPIVMFNYGVLTTGFDAPKTSAAIIARPTKSLVLYSQMVGRATRGKKAGGNKKSEIVTVTDTDMQGFGDVAAAFCNWEDVWNEQSD